VITTSHALQIYYEGLYTKARMNIVMSIEPCISNDTEPNPKYV